MDWYSSAQHGVSLLGPKAEIELTGEGRGTLVANGYFSCIAVVNEASDNEREDKEEEEKQNYGTITEEVIVSILYMNTFRYMCYRIHVRWLPKFYSPDIDIAKSLFQFGMYM